MLKILLIGGNGYLGSKLWPLLQKHFDCESVDLCLFGKNLGYSIEMDFSCLQTDYLAKFDCVILLAAHSSVPLALSDPQGAVRNNVCNLIQLQKLMPPNQKLIYASSTGVYGTAIRNAMETQSTFQAHNYYDITKQVADVFIQDKISAGHKIIGLRFGTLCGSSANTRGDMILNSMVYNAVVKKSFWYNNPEICRSILHVHDAANAVVAILRKHFEPGIYNIKSFDTTVHEAAQKVAGLTGCQPQVKPPSQNVYDFSVSSQKFEAAYDFKPEHTLETTIQELIDNLGNCNISYRNIWPQNNGTY